MYVMYIVLVWVEDRGWRIEGGGWRVEGGGWRVKGDCLHRPAGLHTWWTPGLIGSRGRKTAGAAETDDRSQRSQRGVPESWRSRSSPPPLARTTVVHGNTRMRRSGTPVPRGGRPPGRLAAPQDGRPPARRRAGGRAVQQRRQRPHLPPSPLPSPPKTSLRDGDDDDVQPTRCAAWVPRCVLR